MGHKTYGFEEQLRIGEEHEKTLDAYLGRWYEVIPATMAEQRRGIDRTIIAHDSGNEWKVEYKADERASKSGNAFVETVSAYVDDMNETLGWAHTSQADLLLYYLPQSKVVYVWDVGVLRSFLREWNNSYPKRFIQNEGYKAIGILIPLKVFGEGAKRVINL
jgi:hypothetical protein